MGYSLYFITGYIVFFKRANCAADSLRHIQSLTETLELAQDRDDVLRSLPECLQDSFMH